MNSTSKSIFALATLAVASVLGACGARIDGTYVGGDMSFLESLTFKPGGKVNVTFMGMTKQGTYLVEGNQVTVTIGADSNVFTIDDRGCLVGGGLLGNYCREGGAGGKSTARTDQLAGAYVARVAGGSIALEFDDERVVRMIMTDPDGTEETNDASYQLQGDRITIAGPTGERLELTRTGNALEGSMGGLQLKFDRQ